MTITPDQRRLLPMLGHTRGNRSATVCHWKCADACSHPAPNTTDTSYFPEIVAKVLRRRSVLAGGLGAIGAAAVGSLAGAAPAAAHDRSDRDPLPESVFAKKRSVPFTPIDPVASTVDELTVPEGWTWAPVVSWGDPIFPGAPAFDPTEITPETQAQQFGYNNDYLTIIPVRDDSGSYQRAILVANHEYYNPELMFPDWGTEATPEKALSNLEAAMVSMGLSVVGVRRRKAKLWSVDLTRRGSKYNRRITFRTEFDVTGPAAGSSYLKTSADPTGLVILGTANNCAGGTTPWGTVLSGEENWNQYFKAPAGASSQPRLARYGVTTTGSAWEKIDSRYDLSVEPNEVNRYGYVIEVDPFEPDARPVKHTALGRLKHEGATIKIAPSGHAVAYMGDDERFDYVYKFVSKRKYKSDDSDSSREHNKKLLSEGNLYVARFTDGAPADDDFDGTGQWLPLLVDGVSQVPGFTADEVCVFTRLAADAVSPTKMDRPEDVQPSPRTGYVYVACTNNTSRTAAQVDEASPRAKNKDGHVVEIIEDRGDARSLTFAWNLILVCGDPEDPTIPTYFGGYTGPVSPISCPDNVAFDGEGNLWISTDGQPSSIKYNDALHRVRVSGPDRGLVEQFLAVPTGAETCGPVIDSDDQSVFVAVQHPGDTGATYAAPSSGFPYLEDGFDGPRPAVVQVWREGDRDPFHHRCDRSW